MESVYYDPSNPASFGGIARLARYSNRPVRDVRKFLGSQRAYTLHRPVRRRFDRRKTFAKGINDLLQVDICDLSSLSNWNDGYRYLLNCIDAFSRYAHSVPLKTKSADEVAEAFERRILGDKSPPNFVQSDKGTEFLNSKFQSMLSRRGIRFYTSENDDIKASLVERFNRTLKERLHRYMTYKNTKRYVDVLPEILRSYNDSPHRSIGLAPSEVTRANEDEIARILYPPKPAKFAWRFAVGDAVRTSVSRAVFRKGYVGGWTEEIFEVSELHPTDPPTYGLVDSSGEPIKGKFYAFELQKVDRPSAEIYSVEKVLRTRRRAGRVEYFVKWLGYPDSANSWTDELHVL